MSHRARKVLRSMVLTVGALTGVAVSAVVFGVIPGAALSRASYEELRLFSDVLGIIRERYVGELDEAELLRGAVRGMLDELDPNSSYLSPEDYREMQINARGEFHGLGIEIAKGKEGFVEVVSPILGTPASRAGIRARDRIVEICPTVAPEDWEDPCRSTKDMPLHEAARQMRGKRGTIIVLRIWREGFERPRDYSLRRDLVRVDSVSGHFLAEGYAYLRISQFQERTTADLRSLHAELLKEAGGEFRGLVLDLRNNPGGLLEQAVSVSDLFLDHGLVVSTRGRSAEDTQEFFAHPEGERFYPMTVLVNEGSASASEIVAGALQDHRRAMLVGASTYGKGSVQTLYPLRGEAALRLTTSHYYTPSGRSIQETGIAPDIPAEQSEPAAGEEEDARGEEADADADDEEAAWDPGLRDDAQLARALEVLKSWSYFEGIRQQREARNRARTAEAPQNSRAPTP
ncbi:MAG: S41 family peptidase [Deltaproteobacteria bacterium]|nr:S41 family peptidase [Deltaproteobacteria bacterium]